MQSLAVVAESKMVTKKGQGQKVSPLVWGLLYIIPFPAGLGAQWEKHLQM